VVTEINAEPAAEEYARIAGMPLDELTPNAFATHPMVVRVGEQSFVRSIQRVNPDHSLTFLCAIDEGAVMTVGRGGDLIGNLQASFDEIARDIRLHPARFGTRPKAHTWACRRPDGSQQRRGVLHLWRTM
jgi:hypothetical protein